MNILYVTTATSKEQYKKLFAVTNGNINHSIQKFHSQVINGLQRTGNRVTVLSGTQLSPHNCQKRVFKNFNELEDDVLYYHAFVLNFPILKYIFMLVSMVLYFFKWLYKNRKTGDKKLILDAAYVSMNPFLVFLANIFEVKIGIIVCDIYDYMSLDVSKEKKRNILQKIMCLLTNYVFKNASYFILLTEQMNSVVNKKNRPYIVMEGIFDSSSTIPLKKRKKENIIMYAGNLSSKFGVKELVDAFVEINEEKMELHLYGNGDLVEYIKEVHKHHKRVKYMGIKSFEELFKLEQEAFLLVNPRNNDGEYTKFSFPSKTMEYMASETPVLCYKLDGIPNEYYDYVYIVDSDLKDSLKKILQKDKNELAEKGSSAHNFILENKNEMIQAKKITRLIKKKESCKKDIVTSKLFNIYVKVLFIFCLILSRNTLYSTVIIGTRLSFSILCFLSIPLLLKYLKIYKNGQHNKKSFNILLLFIIALLLITVLKFEYVVLDFSIIYSFVLAFLITQFISLREIINIYLKVLCFLCVTSLFNMYILQPIFLHFDLIWKGMLVHNSQGYLFLNFITSFTFYGPGTFAAMRNYSIFNEPSYFQFYIIFGLILCCCKKTNIRTLLYIIIFITTLFSTFSTAGLICLPFVVVAIVYSLFSKRKISKKILIGLIMSTILIFGLFIFINPTMKDMLIMALSKIVSNNESANTRYGGILEAITLFFKHPILGVSVKHYFNNRIIANTLPTMFALYGIVGGTGILYYTTILCKRLAKSMTLKILIFIILLLSSNSHIYLAVPSFWILLFLGISKEDEYENIMGC